jgi:VCBS repeat-containing protein
LATTQTASLATPVSNTIQTNSTATQPQNNIVVPLTLPTLATLPTLPTLPPIRHDIASITGSSAVVVVYERSGSFVPNTIGDSHSQPADTAVSGTITVTYLDKTSSSAAWSYTFVNANYQYLAEGESVQVTVPVSVDGNTFSIPVTIYGTNENPIITPVHTATTVSPHDAATPTVTPALPSISADGTYIPYQSAGHVFLYDRVTNSSTKIDPSQHGESYGGASISADGRFVVFQGTDGTSKDIFIFDRDSGQATLLADPTTHNAIEGTAPKISVDGQFIALVQGSQVLVADRNGTIIDKISGADAVLNPSISPDGRLVTFLSTGASVSVNVDHGASTSTTTLPAPHGAGPLELYVYDRNTDTITAVTEVAPNGSNSNVQAPASISAADSATQHYKIAFASAATNATVVDTTHSPGVFVVELDGSISSSTLDQVTHTTSVIGAGNYQPQITVDGRYVVFTNATTHTAYLYDLATASTVQLGGAGSAATADLTLNSAATTSGIGIVAALVATGGTGLTVLDDTALLNSSAGDQHGAAFAAVTEDLAATTLATAGRLPF